MGKESRIKQLQQGEKKEYISNGNGKRKEWTSGERTFFEPDTPPEGVNTDIWHLAMYFIDKAHEMGEESSAGPPIVYSFLKKALTNLSAPAILACARVNGIDTTRGNDTWIAIVEGAIDEYYHYDNDSSINKLTTPSVFKYYVQRSIDTLERELLLRTGKQVVQPDRDIKPSRRTEEEKLISRIRAKQYTEEELIEKMRDFKSRSSS